MSPEQKTESFLLRMGVTEVSLLQAISDHTGLTRSDVVRQLIRKEHAALFGNASEPAKRRKGKTKR